MLKLLVADVTGGHATTLLKQNMLSGIHEFGFNSMQIKKTIHSGTGIIIFKTSEKIETIKVLIIE